jgi:hypothetical protein
VLNFRQSFGMRQDTRIMLQRDSTRSTVIRYALRTTRSQGYHEWDKRLRVSELNREGSTAA